MIRWKKTFLGNRGLGINMLACFSFVMLAVYGWGTTWDEVGYYLLWILVVFGSVLLVAFLLGFLIRKIRNKS